MADFLGLMKQAAELKSKMETMQAELDGVEIAGTAGGGLVTITLTGKGDMKGVKIDPSLIKPEEVEIIAADGAPKTLLISSAPIRDAFGVISGAVGINVDITEQLVNMITAQRNFQANAQMIQTSDAVTQTIINIR